MFTVKDAAPLMTPYENMTAREYGQKAGRRVPVAVLVSPIALFAKKRNHYLSYSGQTGSQGTVFELEKDIVRTTLTVVGVSSKKRDRVPKRRGAEGEQGLEHAGRAATKSIALSEPVAAHFREAAFIESAARSTARPAIRPADVHARVARLPSHQRWLAKKRKDAMPDFVVVQIWTHTRVVEAASFDEAAALVPTADRDGLTLTGTQVISLEQGQHSTAEVIQLATTADDRDVLGEFSFQH